MPEHYDDIRSMIKSKKSCRYAGSPTKEHERFTRLIKYGLSDFPDTEETRRSWISSLDRLDPDMVTGFIRWLNNYGGSEVGGPISSLSDLYNIDSSAVPNLMMDLEMYLNEDDQGAQPPMEPGLPPMDESADDAEILETNQRPKGIKEENYGKGPSIDLESEKLKDDEAAIAAENEKKGEKPEKKDEKSDKKGENSDKKDEKTESSTKSVKKSDAEELQDDEPAPEMEDSDDSDGDIEYSDLAGILVDIEDSLGKEVADEILDILMEHLDDDEFDAVMEAKEDAEGDPGVSESESFEEEEPETVSEEDNEPEGGYVSIRECINLRKSGKRNASYLMEMTAFRKANQSGQPLTGQTPDPTSETGTDPSPNTNTPDPSQMRQQYQQARRKQNAQARHGTQAHTASPQEQVRQDLEEARNQPDPFQPLWERQQNGPQQTPGSGEGRMTEEQLSEAKRRYREEQARRREEEIKMKMAERGKQEYQEKNAPADPNAASRTAATQAKRQAKKKKNAKGEAQQPVKEDAQQPVQGDAQQPVQGDPNAASRAAAAGANREQAQKEKAARDAKKQEILQAQSDAYNAQYGANAQAANNQAKAGAGAGAGGSGGNYYSMFGSRLNGQPGLLSRLAQWIRNYRLNRMKIKQAGQQATAGAAPAPAPQPQQNPAA